jgi:prefoldin subunit 5
MFEIVIRKDADRATKKLQKKLIELQKKSNQMEKEIEEAQQVEEEVLLSAVTV